jgi:hypothetical protein
VVEVVSGFAKRHGVKVGDRLRIDGVRTDGTEPETAEALVPFSCHMGR